MVEGLGVVIVAALVHQLLLEGDVLVGQTGLGGDGLGAALHFLFREAADVTRGLATPHLTGRDLCVKTHERACLHLGILAHDGAVCHHGARTDHTSIFQCARMNDASWFHNDVVADRSGVGGATQAVFGSHVHSGVVTNARVGSHANGIGVSAEEPLE